MSYLNDQISGLVCLQFQISGMVCFLLSPAASLISGETVKVDGGASLYSTTWVINGRFILNNVRFQSKLPNILKALF